MRKEDAIIKIAEDLVDAKSILVLGRGYNFATCLEGALVRLATHALGSYDSYTLRNVYMTCCHLAETEGVDLHSRRRHNVR